MLPPACCAAETMGDVLPTAGWLWAPGVGAGITAGPLSPGSHAVGKEEPRGGCRSRGRRVCLAFPLCGAFPGGCVGAAEVGGSRGLTGAVPPVTAAPLVLLLNGVWLGRASPAAATGPDLSVGADHVPMGTNLCTVS